MKTIYIALMLIFTGSAFAELTTEYPATNTVRISRNGELLLVKSTSPNVCADLVFFKNQCVLDRRETKDFTSQIFPPNAPISVSLDDEDHDGHPDRVQLFTIDGSHKTIHDLLHIGTDGRFEPFSDEELQAEQEIYSNYKDSQQPVFSQETQRQRLTTNILEQMYATLEKAENTKDLDTSLAYLSTNVVITVSFSINSETQKIVFSKDSYTRYIMDAWVRTGPVSYKRLKTVFEIAEDAQSAIVTSTFRQTATMKDTGEIFRSTGRAVSTVKLINGVPMAVNVDITVSFQ